MRRMKNLSFKGLGLALMMALGTQTAPAQLTLDEAQADARANYPTIRQYDLVRQSRDYTVENAAKAWLPQVSLTGRASYQSETTKMPFDLSQMGIDYDGLPKDQYDAHVQVNQNIYDGGEVKNRQQEARLQADVQTEQLNVTLYGIRERVNQLYFGVLLLDEQIRQNQLLQKDLGLSLGTVTAMVKGGIANQTDVDAVKVQQIEAEQQEGSLKTQRRAYLTMLGSFIGKELAESTTLEKPSDQLGDNSGVRPELQLYQAQDKLLDVRLKKLDTALRPRLSAYAQGGYGNPGLNMLKDGWDPYYKIGLNLTWNFGALYTRKNDKKLIDTERAKIQADRETFLFNQRLQQQQTNGAIENYRSLVTRDDEIIRLREAIRSKSEKKVQNGTETVNEMLRDINAVAEARQQKAVHEMQLLQEIHELRTINNN